jgi:pyridinium-3,5-biscarboxylic acid mononucleotide sulfurtransferase
MTKAPEPDTPRPLDLDAIEGRLTGTLLSLQPVAIAVSGGVDSLTLATLARRALPDGASSMFHAVSPAVPMEATARVRALARQENWSLTVFDAGEFGNENYRSNPVNRCFHCKHSLYEAIRRLTDATILSGANQDDLGEYRPGLEAARLFGVRHPYVEAGLAKAGVRALAARLGLGNIADLPAAPCLASRVESGIRIEAESLRLIHRVEQLIAASLKPKVVRCRIRRSAIVIELDPSALGQLSNQHKDRLTRDILSLPDAEGAIPPGTAVRYELYRVGSAFLNT